MTNPDKPGIVERLTRKQIVYKNEKNIARRVNPDGPEAAAIITELAACLEAVTIFSAAVIDKYRLTDTNDIIGHSRRAIAKVRS